MATSAAEQVLLPAAPRHSGGAQEELWRARAEVARLKLELRAVTRNADAVEQAEDTSAPLPEEAAEFDLAGARELLASSLTHQLDTRRSELAAELDEARAEAAHLVESAHKRAEAYVAAAHDTVLAAAVHPEEPVGPLPPLPLEVVPDAPRPSASEVVTEEPTVSMRPEGVTGIETMVAAMQALLTHAAVAPATTVAPVVAVRRARPPLRTRLLHADVILPLIAVLAVLIVLIAWVG